MLCPGVGVETFGLSFKAVVDVSRWRLSAKHSTRQNHTCGETWSKTEAGGGQWELGCGVRKVTYLERKDAYVFGFRKITVDTIICRMVWESGGNS